MAETLSLALEICPLGGAPKKYEVTKVTIPGAMGTFTVLPRHAPLVATLEKGTLKAQLTSGEPLTTPIQGGLAHVLNNQVLILTHLAGEVPAQE